MPQTKERSRATGSSRRNGRGGSPGTAGERRITARNTTAQERQFLDRNARWLSPSTLRAKWIHRPDEHEDRPGQTLATKDAEVIQAWATARRAKPATVGRREGDRPRTLRFDFPTTRAAGDWSRSTGANG